MGFKNGGYASVFSVSKGQGNFYDVNIATSRKRRDTNEYETDFRGFVRFVGNAATAIANLDGMNAKNNGNLPIARIKLGDVDVTNSYNRETKKSYTNFVVFSFEYPDAKANGNQNNGTAPKTANDYANNVPTGDDEELFT